MSRVQAAKKTESGAVTRSAEGLIEGFAAGGEDRRRGRPGGLGDRRFVTQSAGNYSAGGSSFSLRLLTR